MSDSEGEERFDIVEAVVEERDDDDEVVEEKRSVIAVVDESKVLLPPIEGMGRSWVGKRIEVGESEKESSSFG
jgi:hypothetical protein